VTDLSRICTRRAALLRELAGLEEELGRAVAEALPTSSPNDEALGLAKAAAFMGEPPETFRRRLDYRKALISRPGERRLRYSRAKLDRIRADRLAANAVAHLMGRGARASRIDADAWTR
jgi:hypothetical protein